MRGARAPVSPSCRPEGERGSQGLYLPPLEVPTRAPLLLLPLFAGCDTELIQWKFAEQESPDGVFLSAWGIDPEDTWVVGGQEDAAAIRRGSGQDFAPFAPPEGAPLLTWVHGTAADDLWVVGIRGTIQHWDGSAWTDHSLPIEEALWGVHARGPTDAIAVGGFSSWGGQVPVAYQWDGSDWTALDLPAQATAEPNLFKVTWDGASWWIVGAGGIALTGAPDEPLTVAPTGFADDLVTIDAHAGPLLAVGGRNTGAVLEPSGAGLALTSEARAGLQGVSVYSDDRALVVGENGFSGLYEPSTDTLLEALPISTDVLHGCFVTQGGDLVAVGGNLFTASDQFLGTILVSRPPKE